MEGHCRVSVIIPIYNISEQYIETCVKSFLLQTFKDIELILVDDGSQDEIAQFCDALVKGYANCTVLHQVNQGVSIARNNGFVHAIGEWIMFADPDDYVEPTLIERLLSNCDARTDVICCCCKVFADNINDTDYFYPNNIVLCTPEEKKELYLQLLDPNYGQPGTAYTAIGVPWGKLYRKKFLDVNHLTFDPELRRMQDNVFNMYAFHAAKCIKYINEPLYIYRYEHLQGYQKKYNETNLTTNLNIISKRKECMESLGLLQDSFLQQAYLLEAFSKLKVMIRYGALHKQYPGSRTEQKNELLKIMSFPVIEALMLAIKENKPLKSKTDQLIYQLMCRRFWSILKILWRLKDALG